ncbi:MAG: dihydropteroate synthase [Betaproteobacteria bacterium]|nr:dihydropteroate synthase [Betaproteobacteria bacterium]
MAPFSFWRAGRFDLALGEPLVMGIVNVTPDSFSDGGRHDTAEAAISHARQLLDEGAQILDIGGESTRPGAQPVSPQQEWERVAPVVRELVQWRVPLSVDTRRTEVMARALDAGADIINDVQALQAPGALDLLVGHDRVGVCLMHMRGEPTSMQQQTHYEADVVQEVRAWLARRVQVVRAAGVAPERMVLDPGIGFAKTAEHNLALLRRQTELLSIGLPLLVGWSRKSTLGVITGRPAHQRQAASLAAALLAAQAGASVLRVHDVAATVDALSVWRATVHGKPSQQGRQ